MKKLIVIAMVLGLVSIASAVDATWTGGTGNWNVTGNWTGGYPNASTVTSEQVGAFIDSSTAVVTVPAAVTVSAHRMFLNGAAAGTPTLNVYGNLNVLGAYAQVGKVVGGNAVMNVYDGANIVAKGLGVADAGTGTLNVHGGTIQVGVAAGNALNFGIAGTAASVNSTGYVTLYDGTLDISLTTGLRMATAAGTTATLDIRGGSLIVPGNVTSANFRTGILTQNASGIHLLAYGVEYAGDTMFAYNYDGVGKTTITAIPEPATIGLLGLGGLALIRRKRS